MASFPKYSAEEEASRRRRRRAEEEAEEARKRAEEQARQAELARYVAKKRAQRQTGKTAVMAFARCNPPHTGHERLIRAMQTQAQAVQADLPVLFPSQSQDGKKNPLPYRTKVRFLRAMFPQVYISENSRIKTPLDALKVLSLMGFDRVYVVCGSDRQSEFERIGNYIKPEGDRMDANSIVLKTYRVVPVERDTDSMSGTKQRAAAVAGDYQTFRKGVPTRNDSLAKQLFNSIRIHMGLKSFAQHIKEASTAVQKAKEPTEVDRLKIKQKQEVLTTKQRQGNDLLQAQKRELEKKSREQLAKATNRGAQE